MCLLLLCYELYHHYINVTLYIYSAEYITHPIHILYIVL